MDNQPAFLLDQPVLARLGTHIREHPVCNHGQNAVETAFKALAGARAEGPGQMSEPQLAARRLRVMVVDDHPLTHAAVESTVQRHSDLEICGHADASAEAIDMAVRLRPDVILLDLRLDGTLEDGVELAGVFVGLVPDSKVLVYSGYLVQRCVSELMHIGVAGYLPQTVHLEALVSAIRTVAAGERVFAPEGTQGLGAALGTGHRSPSAPVSPLTEREIEAVRLISEGLDNAELARRLSLSESSVRLCLTSAFAKLGASNRTEAVVKAHRLGVITID